MSFDKKELLKIADRVKKDGISVSSLKGLEKKASDLKIAFLISVIKR